MSKFSGNYFYNILLTISNVLFPVISFPYVSRILGPDGIGKVHFANSFAQYFVFIATLGIPVYGMRAVAKVKDDVVALKTVFTTLFLLNVATSLIVFLFYLIVIYLTPQFFLDFDFYLVAGLLLLFSFLNVDWVFSGLERFKYIALRSVLVKSVFFVVLFLVVKDKEDDIEYLLIVIGVTILNNVLNIYQLRNYYKFRLFKFINLKQHVRPLLYIFGTVVAASVYSSIDTILLGFLKGYVEVGYYSAAARLNRMIIPFLTALPLVLMPKMTQLFIEKEMGHFEILLVKTFDLIVLVGIPACFGIIALAPDLILILAGKNFEPAILSMRLMSPVVLIISLSTIWVLQVLTPADKDLEASLSVACGLLVSIILNFLLIPRFGYIGATVANLFAELAVLIGFASFSSRIVKLYFDYKSYFISLALSILFIPIIYILRLASPENSFIVVFSSIIICSIYYFGLQILVFKQPLLTGEFNRLIKGLGRK